PRGGGERRARPGLERYVFRLAAQPHHAPPGSKHERWLGNSSPARAPPRLGGHQNGGARHNSPRGGGDLPPPKEFFPELFSRSLRRARSGARRSCASVFTLDGSLALHEAGGRPAPLF